MPNQAFHRIAYAPGELFVRLNEVLNTTDLSRVESDKHWDVMLSYRHARHKAIVSALVGFLEEAGVRCWLDIQRIDQSNRLPEVVLKDILRHAAETSRIVVGFPAEDMLAMDPESGETRKMPSWLFWERQFAREVLWVSGNYLYAFPDAYIRFWGLPHLAYFLGLACGRGMALGGFWTKYFAHWPRTNQIAYHAGKLHELPSDDLPPFLQPNEASARRNAIHASSLHKRSELAKDHCMEIFE